LSFPSAVCTRKPLPCQMRFLQSAVGQPAPVSIDVHAHASCTDGSSGRGPEQVDLSQLFSDEMDQCDGHRDRYISQKVEGPSQAGTSHSVALGKASSARASRHDERIIEEIFDLL